MTTTIPLEIDVPRRRFRLGGEPMLFHCHHYNTYLQRSIQDAAYVDSEPYLIGAAAEVAFAQLASVFEEGQIAGVSARKEIAEDIYRWAGFGTFDLAGLDESGGWLTTPNSHYSMAWSTKFGSNKRPVCYFASGWLCGALAAIHDLPLGSFSADHTSCSAVGVSSECAWEVRRGKPNYCIFRSPGSGVCSSAAERVSYDQGNLDYEKIYAALTAMDLVGGEDGHIPAFGVHLTRHFANYYSRITFETERAIFDLCGEPAIAIARPLFVEAGHVCAFHTFGGIMTSTEWDALIRPSLQSSEDWVHGIVAAVNALGWGRWQVTDLSPEAATFVLHDDYESNAYRGMYGESDHPVSYLAEGAAAGIMNLVYRGDVASRPEFTPALYEFLFKGDGNFAADQLTSQAMGHDATTIRVTRG